MTRSIEERLAALESIVESLRPVDLNDKYADFTVRRTPPQWLEQGGPCFAGVSISQTNPEFCEALASYLDWTASKDEAKNYSYVNGKGDTVFPAKFARKDAARARAWAVKLRQTQRPNANEGAQRRAAAGQATAPRRAPVQPDFGDYADANDEIPF